MDVAIIGAGAMAQSYLKVMSVLNAKPIIIGRGHQSCDNFTESTGVRAHPGGIQSYVDSVGSLPRAAIVAVDCDQLSDVSLSLVRNGVRRILIEKPAALYLDDLLSIDEAADSHGCKISVAYNRRFLASVTKARQLIVDAGGLTSVHFEFTEWSHVIGKTLHPTSVKERWFLANSTHVSDLAFHLMGLPDVLSPTISGSLDWHHSGSVFSGSGMSVDGIPFSYHANWESAGCWKIELMTCRSRLILAPLEGLSYIERGAVEQKAVCIDQSLDNTCKPGLLQMTKSFLQDDDTNLCSLKDHIEAFPWHCKMAGYKNSLFRNMCGYQ